MRLWGYRPSLREDSDYPVERMLALAGARDKSIGSCGLEYQVVQVLDQGPLGSCVFNGLSQMIRMRNRADVPGSSPPLPSRLLPYYCSRDSEGLVHIDCGADPKTAIKMYRKYGYCDEQHWPYFIDKFDVFPGMEAFRLSYDHRAFEYYFILSSGARRVEECKLALDAGYAVGIGTTVGSAFDAWKAGDPPLLPPSRDELRRSGHFTVLIGYDGDRFLDLNSWGSSWGDHGKAWLSADYIAWSETKDLLVIRRAPKIPD